MVIENAIGYSFSFKSLTRRFHRCPWVRKCKMSTQNSCFVLPYSKICKCPPKNSCLVLPYFKISETWKCVKRNTFSTFQLAITSVSKIRSKNVRSQSKWIKVAVLHGNARRYWRKLISLRSLLSDNSLGHLDHTSGSKFNKGVDDSQRTTLWRWEGRRSTAATQSLL